MDTGLFPLITTEFVAKDDSIIRFELFNREVGDVEDRNSPMSPGMGPWYAWYHANWRVPAEEPIVIEWASDKKDTIIGSTCTVTLVSPYDGALQTLYTTDPRLWCCLVSRKAAGADSYSDVWFGWLDPEFYEEPFIANKDYEVTLTFCDFGVLKRLKVFPPFNQTFGLFTMNMMINCALAQIDATCGDYDYSQQPRYTQYTSTERTDGTKVIGGGLQVQIANFTDEDGEVMTWYDALEAILRPLALRIEQRAGRYYLYDINKLVADDVVYTETTTSRAYRSEVLVWWAYQMDELMPSLTHRTAADYSTEEEALAAGSQWYASHAPGFPYEIGRVEINAPVVVGTITTSPDNWSGTDQKLSVDETFNHIKVTFSPYAEAVLFDPEKEVQFETDCDWMPVKNGYDYSSQERYDSFQLSTISAGNTAEAFGGVTVEPNTTLFKIKSLQGGSDCKGVVAFLGDFDINDLASLDQAEVKERFSPVFDGDYSGLYLGRRRPQEIRQDIIDNGLTGQTIYRSRRVLVQNYPVSQLGRKMLKIQIPMLYDPRYNPFEQADDDHNEMRNAIKKYANSIGLRLHIRLYASKTGGSPLFYYQNIGRAKPGTPITTTSHLREFDYAPGLTPGWVPAGTEQNHLPTLIMYCKFDGAKVATDDCQCLGGMNDGGTPFNNECTTDYYFRKNHDGLYIPFPAIGSGSINYHAQYWLEVEVTDGLYIYDNGSMRNGGLPEDWDADDFKRVFLKEPIQEHTPQYAYSDARWWLIGFPKISVVNLNHNIYEEEEVEDIEQSGVIDANAAEELSIDTICGCCDSVVSKGAYINTATGQPVTELCRAGRTAAVEQLLIGTMCSQYAGRHLKLSGTARAVLPLQGLRLLTDSHYSGKRFLVTEETYNVIDCESEITMVEASPDNYTSS